MLATEKVPSLMENAWVIALFAYKDFQKANNKKCEKIGFTEKFLKGKKPTQFFCYTRSFNPIQSQFSRKPEITNTQHISRVARYQKIKKAKFVHKQLKKGQILKCDQRPNKG
jgi:hypothetical protein